MTVVTVVTVGTVEACTAGKQQAAGSRQHAMLTNPDMIRLVVVSSSRARGFPQTLRHLHSVAQSMLESMHPEVGGKTMLMPVTCVCDQVPVHDLDDGYLPLDDFDEAHRSDFKTKMAVWGLRIATRKMEASPFTKSIKVAESLPGLHKFWS